jgi:hypothetical protein
VLLGGVAPDPVAGNGELAALLGKVAGIADDPLLPHEVMKTVASARTGSEDRFMQHLALRIIVYEGGAGI